IDKRVTEIAENAKIAQEQKQAPAIVAPDATASARVQVSLNQMFESASINGLYVLFGLTMARLNNKLFNMRESVQATSLPSDYGYGFLVACSCAELYEGSSSFTEVFVTRLPGADEKFLKAVIDEILDRAQRSKLKRRMEKVRIDLGRLRTYCEDNTF